MAGESGSVRDVNSLGMTITSLWAQSTYSVVAILATVLVALIVLSVQAAQSAKKNLPPGPRPWPVLGSFLELRGDLPHRALQKLATEFGGLMYLRLGSVPYIVVSSSAVAKEVFSTNDINFSSRPESAMMTVIQGHTDYKNLALAPYGPYWRGLRRVCNVELFSPRRHASYQGARTEEIRTMMKELLDDVKKGEAINLRSWLYGVTSNTMTRMLINKRYFGSGKENRHEKEEFELLVARLIDGFSAFVIGDFVPYLNFISKLQGLPKKFADLRDFQASILLKMFEVEKHRQRAKEEKNDENYVPDFVDVLLETPLEDGQVLPDFYITQVLMDMMSAGTETSSTTVEWAMAELMLQPHLMKRAQDELDAVVGPDRIVQESDIPNLPYLGAIVKETMRLHPPAALAIPRESTKPSEIMGYNLPARTRMILNIFAIQRDPNVYKSPTEFIPQRFVEHPDVNHLSGNDHFELIPFGVGRRMCPGNNLGNLMVCLMLSHILHSFDWSFLEGEHAEGFDMSEHFSSSVSRKNPLYLNAKPRSPAFLY